MEQIIRGDKIATRRPFRPMVKECGSYHIKVHFFESLSYNILVKRLYARSWDPRQTVWVVEF